MIHFALSTDLPFAEGRAFGGIGAFRAFEGVAHLAIPPSEIGADGIRTPEAVNHVHGLVEEVSAY